MSTLAFRDSSIVIIDTSRDTVRAVFGLHELLPLPTVKVQARVGLRNEHPNGPSSSSVAPTSAAKANDYLVGAQLDEALATGQDVIVSWPFAEGVISDWLQAEAVWKHVLFTLLSLRRTQNESPVLLTLPPKLSRSSYHRVSQLFFERFNVAALTILDRPTAQIYATNSLTGVVVDVQKWKTDITVIYDGFVLGDARCTLNVGAETCERYLASILRGSERVMKGLFPNSKEETMLDESHISKVLLSFAHFLLTDHHIKITVPGSGVFNPQLIEDEEGVTDIAAVVMAGREKAVIESNAKRKALSQKKSGSSTGNKGAGNDDDDVITVEFEGKQVEVGRERHRFCEPLWDPAVLKGVDGLLGEEGTGEGLILSIPEAVGTIVRRTDVDLRQYIYQGVFVTGEIANYIKGITASLVSLLSPYLLSVPATNTATNHLLNEVQPRAARALKVPEYFAEFREKGDGLAGFLGGEIVAKITFHDPNARNFVSKADYSVKGPQAVIDMSASLL